MNSEFGRRDVASRIVRSVKVLNRWLRHHGFSRLLELVQQRLAQRTPAAPRSRHGRRRREDAFEYPRHKEHVPSWPSGALPLLLHERLRFRRYVRIYLVHRQRRGEIVIP